MKGSVSASLRPASALKLEQVQKLVNIYKGVRTQIETMWEMTDALTAQSLAQFQEQAKALRTTCQELGKNEMLNTNYSRLPASIADASAEYADATARLWARGDRNVARQKKVVLTALVNEQLALFSSKERRVSKTTDDMKSASEMARAAAVQPAALGASMGGGQVAAAGMALGLHNMVARSDVPTMLKALQSGRPSMHPDTRDSNNRTPLMIAAALNKLDHARVLLKDFKANPNLLDNLRCTALLIACAKGHFGMAHLLLASGADWTLALTAAKPLDYLVKFDPGASGENQQVFLTMLPEVNVKFPMRQDDSMLAIACSFQNTSFVQQLLKRKGIDVNAVNKFGESALHKCARLANIDLIKLLLQAGANTEIEGSNGKPIQVLPKTCQGRLQIQALLVPKRVMSPPMARSVSGGGGGGSPTGAPSSPQAVVSPPPRMTDTLRRLAFKSNNDGRDAFDVLNELLEEVKQSGASSAALSPGLSKQSAASPTRVDATRKSVDGGAAGATVCSECHKAAEGTWCQFTSLGETDKRFVCKSCLLDIKNRIGRSRTSSIGGAAAALAVPTTLPPGRHFVVEPSVKSPMLRVEMPDTSNSTPFAPLLEDVFEPYRLQFFNKTHMGFASMQLKSLACVAFTAKDGFFKCLALTPSGHVLHEAKEDILLSRSGSTLKEKMLSYVQELWLPSGDWTEVTSEDTKMFQLELLGLEASHATNASAFRIGIVYAEGFQTSEEQFYANTLTSTRFQAFLELMGECVQVNSFSGFSGGFEDLSTTNDKHSYYCSWLNLEIMYHVAPLLSADEQRRLLGNDLVLVYWHEATGKTGLFQPYEFRGNVNSVAIVVRPLSEDKFVCGCFTRKRVREFGPVGGVEVAAADLRNWILTKAINGILAAQKSPPFAQMISKLYTADIEKILVKYVGQKKLGGGKSKSLTGMKK